jgi:molybdopterin converting factor subunit 1
LFARLREIATAGELEREIPAPATAQTAWESLAREYPALEAYRPIISCAVNEQYARFETPLQDGDEVAFLPPVSGGGLIRDRDSDSGFGIRIRDSIRDSGFRFGIRDSGLGILD